MNNIFEIATRGKYRFPFKGLISVEDLWDLSPAQLDSIYKTLSREAKAKSEDSLLEEAVADKKLTTMIEIVKHIFNVKMDEDKAAKAAAENRKKRNRIAEILARKEDESLNNLSTDELTKMLNDLE